MAAEAIPNFNIQLSPESHDEKVRRAFGRTYDNNSLHQSIDDALEFGCRRIDLFFMIGIPEQTPQSVMETVMYCGELLERYDRASHRGRLHPYIAPYAPFLDPGSKAFEEPKKYGYRLFHRTLEEHRKALLAPSWKYTLSYETKWMSRDQLVDVTYEAALQLNRIKLEHGLVDRKEAGRIQRRIAQEKTLIKEIDALLAVQDDNLRQERLAKLMAAFEAVGPSTTCQKDAMNWPVSLVRFNPLRILKGALRGR